LISHTGKQIDPTAQNMIPYFKLKHQIETSKSCDIYY